MGNLLFTTTCYLLLTTYYSLQKECICTLIGSGTLVGCALSEGPRWPYGTTYYLLLTRWPPFCYCSVRCVHISGTSFYTGSGRRMWDKASSTDCQVCCTMYDVYHFYMFLLELDCSARALYGLRTTTQRLPRAHFSE